MAHDDVGAAERSALQRRDAPPPSTRSDNEWADETEQLEPDADAEDDYDGDDDDAEDNFVREPPELEAGAPSASFSVSNPFRGLDERAIIPAIVLGLLAVFVRWRRRRKRRKATRSNTPQVWAWKTDYETPKGVPVDLSRPLLGCSLAIGENIPVAGRQPSLAGVPERPDAPGDHSIVRTLCDAGATLAGAVCVDPVGASGASACTSCSFSGSRSAPGRTVMGSNGALAAVVASGAADLGVGIDTGSDVAVATACTGGLAFRCSYGALEVLDGKLLVSSGTCAAPVLVCHNSDVLSKVSKVLSLPGSKQVVDDLRMLITADLFIKTDAVATEKVTNGIVTRSVTSWISDRDHVRQVELLPWLAKELDGWDYFASLPRGSAEASDVLDGIAAAHKIIVAYETQEKLREWQADCDAIQHGAARALIDAAETIERSDYDAAMQLRTDFASVMQSALSPNTAMLMPILAGATPRVPRPGAPVPASAQPMFDLTTKFAALLAMSSCPAAVLPVPALEANGAPWAVLIMGRHRCDLQLMQLAVRLSGHIDKTAAALRAELKESRSEDRRVKASKRPEMTVADREAEADVLKAQGNAAFKSGDFIQSHELYSKALQFAGKSQKAVLYSNRAMAYLKLNQPELAMRDCIASLELAWSSKAAYRHGTAAMALGMHSEAQRSFEAVLAREPGNKEAAARVEECEVLLHGAAVDVENGAADEDAML